ncbi:MAG: CAP domain-containing protein [Patescibacteria group bacterium]
MKKYGLIVFVILLAGLLWSQRFYFANLVNKNLPNIQAEVKNNSVLNKLEKSVGQVMAPPPLVSSRQSATAQLTVFGVISRTNAQRQQNGGLPALKENARLNAAATAKLNDMFKQQYFEHTSPQGKGPADLAKTAGYEYIAVGENLALGNFDNDRVLVQDWMDSPGHRANILNAQYEEIGVAVGRGEYEGRTVWLAVQEFGRPASSCPKVDGNLKVEMAGLQADVGKLEPQLNELKKYLDSEQPQTQAEAKIYNQKVADYNSMVKIYNNQVDNLKLATERYNGQVRTYNACLD